MEPSSDTAKMKINSKMCIPLLTLNEDEDSTNTQTKPARSWSSTSLSPTPTEPTNQSARPESLPSISKIPRLITSSCSTVLETPRNPKSLLKSPGSLVLAPVEIYSLKVEFKTKNKQYMHLRKIFINHEGPVVNMYQNLNIIKKKLEENGIYVNLEDLPYVRMTLGNVKEEDSPVQITAISEAILDVKLLFIEELQIFSTICGNLLNRRESIIELLDSAVNSEDDIEMSARIHSLKIESVDLRTSFKGAYETQGCRINDLVHKWSERLNSVIRNDNTSSANEVKLLEDKLESERKIQRIIKSQLSESESSRKDAEEMCCNLSKQIENMEDQLKIYKSKLNDESADVINVIKNLENALDKVTKERNDIQIRCSKIESDRKDLEETNFNLSKQIENLEDQLKIHKSKLSDESADVINVIKNLENALDKVTKERDDIQIRCSKIESGKKDLEETNFNLSKQIENMEDQSKIHKSKLSDESADVIDVIKNLENALDKVTKERNDIKIRCNKIEELKDQSEQAYSTIITDLDSRLADMDQQQKELVCENEELVSKIEELKSQLLMKDVDSRESSEEVSSSSPVEEEENSSNLESEAVEEIEEIEDQDETVVEKDNTIEVNQNKMSDILASHEDRFQEHKLHLKEMSNKMSTLQERLNVMQDRIYVLEKDKDAASGKNLTEILATGKEILSDATQKAIQYEKEIDSLNATVKLQADQNRGLLEDVTRKNNKIALLKASRALSYLELKDLKKNCLMTRNALDQTIASCKMKANLLSHSVHTMDVKEASYKLLRAKYETLKVSYIKVIFEGNKKNTYQ